MKVIGRDGAELQPADLRGGTLALGNFDGVHRGHQAVIAAAVAEAERRGVPALVATFDPHPSRHFQPDAAPFSLTDIHQKARHVAGLGAAALVVLSFDAAMAGLAPEAFMRDWLAGRLGLLHVVTGGDFTFGKGRAGNAALLASAGPAFGFTAETVAPVADSDAVISSTRIREALIAGDPGRAAALLSRPFAVRGPVIHGDKRGRTIGVPTANMLMGDYVRPRYGVYAVRIRLPDGTLADGVANLGIRPMFDPPRELLETWILDWDGDLYGQMLEVELLAYLREERRLDGLEALKRQIAEDERAARRVLGEYRG